MKTIRIAAFLILCSAFLLLPFTAAAAGVDITVTGTFNITNLSESNLSTSGITIGWTTDKASTSQVLYGPNSGSYTLSSTLDSTLVTSHSVTLSGLPSGQTYYYVVQSTLVDGASNTVTATSSQDSFTTSTSSSGGGGGGGGGGSDADKLSFYKYMSTTGIFNQDCTIRSLDKMVTISVYNTTVLRDVDSKTINYMTVEDYEASRFKAPDNGKIIGLVYDLGPSGCTFSLPVLLGFSFTDKMIPSGADKRDLNIAVWNYTKKQWDILPNCTVDTENNIVYGNTDHFSMYTVVWQPPAVKFYVSELTLSNENPDVGESFDISTVVSNTGYETGEYELLLSIDDVPVETRAVTVDPGSEVEVKFTRTIDNPGNYVIDINGEVNAAVKVTSPEGPEAFIVSDLAISPAETDPGKKITISANVTNPNSVEMSYRVNLKINGKIVESRLITLAGLASDKVTFETAQTLPGNYEVGVEELTGSFTVAQPPSAAAFSLTNVRLSQVEVTTGEQVTITGTLTNTGDLSGTYEANLLVDGETLETREIELAGGQSKEISFTFKAKGLSGISTVQINNKKVELAVSESITRWVIIGALAGAFAAATGVILVIRRKVRFD